MGRTFAGKLLELLEGRNGKEIPVEQEDRIPKGLCGQIKILYHLYHMGCVGYRGRFSATNILKAVMRPDA